MPVDEASSLFSFFTVHCCWCGESISYLHQSTPLLLLGRFVKASSESLKQRGPGAPFLPVFFLLLSLLCVNDFRALVGNVEAATSRCEWCSWSRNFDMGTKAATDCSLRDSRSFWKREPFSIQHKVDGSRAAVFGVRKVRSNPIRCNPVQVSYPPWHG